ncbi:hypothetical protein NMT12_120024 [metagenome]
MRFLEFIKLIEIGNYLSVEDAIIRKNVNYYILVYSDNIIENENYVIWGLNEDKIRHTIIDI